MMQEKNKHILKDLIRQLPVYQPSDDLWDGIEQDLSAPAPLSARLPQYDPPDKVWDAIEASLEKPVRTRSLLRRVLPWTAAAAAALVGLMWYFQPPTHTAAPAALVSMSYSREIADDALLQRDWAQEEEAFALAEKWCNTSPFTCTNPDMITLRTELDELTDAKMALEEALGKYGTDADLIGQLVKIERQRTVLLKKILSNFI
jgi:hypothetical protein